MEKTFQNYKKLFTSTFYLSAFTFGGGYVIIPLMNKKFVEELGWLEEKEMLDMAAIAQSTPGAMAVNASILVGWQLLGASGAFVAMLGTVLPPLLILSVISVFYASFRDNPVVNAALSGMMAGVSAVVVDVVITMASKIIKAKKIIPTLIMVGAFLASFVWKVNVVPIIIFCAVLGAMLTFRDNPSRKELQ